MKTIGFVRKINNLGPVVIPSYWLYFNEYNACEYVEFEDKKFISGIYPGDGGNYGEIQNIIVNAKDELTLEIFCPEWTALDDTVIPSYTITVKVSSLDDFVSTC